MMESQETGMTLTGGDTIAARCTMFSMDQIAVPKNSQFSFLDSRCTMVSYRDRMTWVSAGTPNAIVFLL